MRQLEGKVAIVTGANSGIGLATARLFVEHGAKVALAARRQPANEQVAAELRAAGGDVIAVQADVSLPADCRRVVAATIAAFGRLDVLVNNAGMGDRHLPIDECGEEWFDTVVKADQYSVYYMTKYALEQMEPRGTGSIVNVSSIGS
ncbi:MAG: SDR family NAD(P)-dependent oxidoreductase, partial [Propionibacteriaceae bacterium]|nr:SDR family NAD(P)-dependent oxidoreductase [Propionibacteriaceae bacterium]